MVSIKKKNKPTKPTRMETSVSQKTLGVKYLSHGNQCWVPIDFTRAQMLPLVKYMDTEPQKFVCCQKSSSWTLPLPSVPLKCLPRANSILSVVLCQGSDPPCAREVTRSVAMLIKKSQGLPHNDTKRKGGRSLAFHFPNPSFYKYFPLAGNQCSAVTSRLLPRLSTFSDTNSA